MASDSGDRVGRTLLSAAFEVDFEVDFEVGDSCGS